MGPASAVWAILDKVVDDYLPVVDGIDDDIEEVEADVFDDDSPAPTSRIYHLKREVIEFHRAVYPLLGPLDALRAGRVPADSRGAAALLPRRRTTTPAASDERRQLPARAADQRAGGEPRPGQRQPDEIVKKISSVARHRRGAHLHRLVYGMNFEYMPELDERWGYPLALGLMALCIVRAHLLLPPDQLALTVAR